MPELHGNAVTIDSSSECQHLPDNVCTALCRSLDRIDNPLSGGIGHFAPQDLDRHHDRREHIVEIMGNTPGERADAFHPLCPQKLCRKPLFLGHIPGNHDDLGNHAVSISDHASLRVDGAFGAVFSHEPIFDPLSNAGFDRFLKHPLHPLPIVRMYLLISIRSLQRLRVTQNTPVGGAIVDPPALQVQHSNHVRDILRDQTKLFFTLPEIFFRLLALGNVAHAAYDCFRIALSIELDL